MCTRRYASVDVNDGKPSSHRPTVSLALRFENSNRCAASCISEASWAKARPMSTNVTGQDHGAHSTVAHSTATVWTQVDTTEVAFRHEGMWRSCAASHAGGDW